MPREVKVVSLQDSEVQFSNGTRLEIKALAGVVTQWSGRGRGLRSSMLPAERDVAVELERALEEVGFQEQETIHVDVGATRSAVRSPGPRGSVADQVVLRPTRPSRDAVQVVWYQDESGGVSWHFPDGFLESATPGATPEATRRSVLRSARSSVFTIPTRTAAAQRAFAAEQPGERLRGPIVKLGRKIFKVLLVPLSTLVARPVESIVGKIERRKRQEIVRPVTAQNYRTLVQEPFTDWALLDGKPSLLIVHGILSSTHGMLSGLPPWAMARLLAHYEGRVIALDQLTVTRSPEQNAADFLRTVTLARPNGRFIFDVLCHSRGGVVSRTLAERGKLLVPQHHCEFRRVFFVASPNAGSRLGDAEHTVEMIDVFTNLVTNFPDGPALYSVEILLAIVKLLAYAAETRLPGIRDMGTSGYIPQTLNSATSPSPAVYAAASADYEPRPEDNAFFNGRLADSVIDRVFQEVENDLVVPRDGVFAANGHPSFPLKDPLVYGPSDHVWHTDYFRRPPTIEAIFRHFGIVHPGVAAGPAGAIAGRDVSVEAFKDFGDAPRERPREGAMVDELLSGRTKGVSLALETLRAPRVGSSTTRRKTKSKGRVGPTDIARPIDSEPIAPAAELERHPSIDFHEQVREGETNELTVRLSDVVAAGTGAPIAVHLAADEESVDLTVRLHAPGFDVRPDVVATVTVHRVREQKTEEARFRLRARRPGKQPLRREITAEFWLHNALVGTVTHYTFVVPKDWTGPAPLDGSSHAATFAIPRARREDCDLILMIEGHNLAGEAPFRVRVRSEIPGSEYASLDCGLLQLPQQDLSAYVRTALDGVIAQYPERRQMSQSEFEKELTRWEADFLTRLKALGKQIWTLLPDRFRSEYFRLYQQGVAPRSICVHSDEMLYPWELAIPNETLNGHFVELPPLGIAHVLGRWKTALLIKPSPQRLRVESFVVINPVYPKPDTLPWAAAETTALKRLFPKLEVFSPSTAARIRTDLLERRDVRILHFSGHGNFNPQNADLSELVLEQGALDALTIARTKLGAEASPIVYLNACSAGSLGVTVGRAGGFAAVCLDGGFSGVIAPYWPVNDARAAKFSIALYQRLLAGRAIGEALRDLRDEHRNDPTFLAFAYYGDPWTRASFDDLLA